MKLINKINIMEDYTGISALDDIIYKYINQLKLKKLMEDLNKNKKFQEAKRNGKLYNFRRGVLKRNGVTIVEDPLYNRVKMVYDYRPVYDDDDSVVFVGKRGIKAFLTPFFPGPEYDQIGWLGSNVNQHIERTFNPDNLEFFLHPEESMEWID